jgi:outer membrane immunogenic protein
MNKITTTLLAGVAVVGFSSSAFAADLIIRDDFVERGVVHVDRAFEGVYIGGFVGYGWGHVTTDDADTVFTGDTLGIDGWFVGVNIGADAYLTDNLVAGVVADVAWSNISGFDESYDTTFDVDWFGSLRGRLGFDAGGFMPYLTAGVAFAGATADYGGDADSNTHIGWTAGAGVEIAATDNVSIDLLYRYSDYGAQTYEIVPDIDLGFTTHTFQAGINFRF